jgi:hypothetical protein
LAEPSCEGPEESPIEEPFPGSPILEDLPLRVFIEPACEASDLPPESEPFPEIIEIEVAMTVKIESICEGPEEIPGLDEIPKLPEP